MELIAWYDVMRMGTQLRLEHEGRHVKGFIKDEDVITSTQDVKAAAIFNLVRLWFQTFGEEVQAMKGPEGAGWAFRVLEKPKAIERHAILEGSVDG